MTTMDDSEKAKAADVLDRAADLLWVKGRCVGTAEGDDGTICASKAIAEAMGIPSRKSGAVASDVSWLDGECSLAGIALSDYLGKHPEVVSWACPSSGSVAVWNDTARGEGSDALVIDTIRRCAKELRA